VDGPGIWPEPYYIAIRTPYGGKPVTCHRILLIACDGKISFENQKIPGQANRLIQENQDRE